MSTPEPRYEDVALEDIVIGSTRRKVTEPKIAALVASIREVGLLQPIGLTEEYRLIWGHHRVEAYRDIGWKTIPSVIIGLNALQAQIAEIDENLQRFGLTKLEEARALKRRKELYEALHPETKKGAQGGGNKGKGTRTKTESDSVSFSVDTATKTGKSKRTVERAVELAGSLPDEVQEAIADTPAADNASQLKKLAALTPAQQKSVAKKLASGKAKTVEEALAVPAKPDPTEPPTAEEAMASSNRVMESLAREITAVGKKVKALAEPHMDEERQNILEAQLRTAAGTIRAAKGAGLCVFCDAKGCKRCETTGWLTKSQFDSAPTKEQIAQ